MTELDIFDLEALIKILAGKFSQIDCIYLFGSRGYQTGSTRSDIDILLTTTSRIQPAKLRDFTLEYCTALDLFILDDGKATSVANESYLQAKDNDELIERVDAVLLYDRQTGSSSELKKRKNIEIDKRINYELTALPNSTVEYWQVSALEKFSKAARQNGLPVKPYLGVDIDEASDFLITVIRSLVGANKNVTNYGQAKNGWTRNLQNEYDFQNLFWITVKPWLPNLSREQAIIIYDGNKKISDFSLFNDQLILEFKHIKDEGSKIAVVKTLEGLRTFYTMHTNVRRLIFAILVEKMVDLDDKKWEADFTYLSDQQSVVTVIIRNE